MPQLCSACQTIPFRELQEDPNQDFSVTIGTYDEVKRKPSCPICKVTLESLRYYTSGAGFSDVDEFAKHVGLTKRNPIQVKWPKHSCSFESYAWVGSWLRFATGSCPKLARAVQSTPIDVKLISSWVENCQATHHCSIAITDNYALKLHILRAIDVRRMCVTPITPNTQYVALSYVWGGVTTLRLLRDNTVELMRPGGLKTYEEDIPLTIRDAIELVRRMDLDYLWVDTLCLVQDDPNDMAVGINAMSIIYECAYFTILAVSGTNANSGLPGLRSREVEQITAEVFPGIKLILIHETSGLLRESLYGKRAWTFQEDHLSRRKVIFLNNMVYFQCLGGAWSEEAQGQSFDFGETHSSNWLIPPEDSNIKFKSLCRFLTQYCCRKLTYQSDCVHAMTGIYRKIFGNKFNANLFGVPIAAFDFFMCFYPSDSVVNSFQRRMRFPSWAWSGWDGQLHWANLPNDNQILDWTARSTWIVWYKRDPVGHLDLIWNDTGRDDNGAATKQILAERVANSQNISTNVLPILPSHSPIPETTERQYGILQFWTVSASYTLRVDIAGEKHLQFLEADECWIPLEIIGRNDIFCGWIFMDEESYRNHHEIAELIVISETDRKVSGNSHWHGRSDSTRLGGPWFNVLFIEWQSGIAERKGIGQIYRDTLDFSLEPGWVWKEIILG
ncbi:HET-domain-containing protein [Xylariaceae sp. FL1651]|nr:HET-domain-containing protein [Xylariaceae sp. FL1651]